MSDDEIRAEIMRAYGVKPWDIGAAPVPLRVRLWRAITGAYRHGVIDWRSYIAAEAEARAAEEAYVAALPTRLAEARSAAASRSDLLPEGMSFEWVTDDLIPYDLGTQARFAMAPSMLVMWERCPASEGYWPPDPLPAKCFMADGGFMVHVRSDRECRHGQ